MANTNDFLMELISDNAKLETIAECIKRTLKLKYNVKYVKDDGLSFCFDEDDEFEFCNRQFDTKRLFCEKGVVLVEKDEDEDDEDIYMSMDFIFRNTRVHHVKILHLDIFEDGMYVSFRGSPFCELVIF